MLHINYSVHSYSNWQLWHSLPTKDTGTIRLIFGTAFSTSTCITPSIWSQATKSLPDVEWSTVADTEFASKYWGLNPSCIHTCTCVNSLQFWIHVPMVTPRSTVDAEEEQVWECCCCKSFYVISPCVCMNSMDRVSMSVRLCLHMGRINSNSLLAIVQPTTTVWQHFGPGWTFSRLSAILLNSTI